MAEFTYYTRIEPRPRANDFTGSLAAEIRDPLWFLTRQWQVGEFLGSDAGSVAFMEQVGSITRMARWFRGTTEVPLDPGSPLERQALSEPFEPDLSTQVELAQDFADFLEEETGNTTRTQEILDAFRLLPAFALTPPPTEPLNPLDASTQRFVLVCADRAVNGVALLELGRSGGSIPPSVTTNAGEIAAIRAALDRLDDHVVQVFGDIGEADPIPWQPERLEYRLKVVAGDPAAGSATLNAFPDGDGELEWFSFDVDARDPTAPEPLPEAVSAAIVPARIEFDGMPSPRFWKFEENTLSLPDMSAFSDDLLKLLVTDFMLLYSTDWFVFPFEQEPGSLVKTDYVLVHDVFDTLTMVERADKDTTSVGTDRFSMFSVSDDSGSVERVASYFLLPPSAGPAMQLGSVLEDVRFGRDEMANMAWGIERVTTSPIGEQRGGRERDAEIDALRRTPTETEPPTSFPFKYRIQTEVPANWVPLLPRQIDPANPSIELQKGAAIKDVGDGPVPVPALGAILNPELTPPGSIYRIAEEEIPRAGLQVQRVVYRTRWIDGSSHLWVQRRRRIGAGESQSGLEFDRALPNTSEAE
jgi:hypothetical protein